MGKKWLDAGLVVIAQIIRIGPELPTSYPHYYVLKHEINLEIRALFLGFMRETAFHGQNEMPRSIGEIGLAEIDREIVVFAIGVDLY